MWQLLRCRGIYEISRQPLNLSSCPSAKRRLVSSSQWPTTPTLFQLASITRRIHFPATAQHAGEQRESWANHLDSRARDIVVGNRDYWNWWSASAQVKRHATSSTTESITVTRREWNVKDAFLWSDEGNDTERNMQPGICLGAQWVRPPQKIFWSQNGVNFGVFWRDKFKVFR